MNQQIFQEWFEKIFVPEVRTHLDSNNLPKKAVLLIDNAPSYPATSVYDGQSFCPKCYCADMHQGFVAPHGPGSHCSHEKNIQNKVVTVKNQRRL